MDYPGYQGAKKEQEILKDMEYLQQVYPGAVKQYQRRVAEILDKMDYEGSMIYDEYPDFTSLRDMADSIVRVMQNEEKDCPEEERVPQEKWCWIKDMVQVLLCDEIYKRRHGGRRGKYFWMN
ncbi:MAG: hypothetical protein J6M66_03100 [Lachnospiraceae bacterium]|nr:hypothetical protein [Lachnospiraceae bacterium]